MIEKIGCCILAILWVTWGILIIWTAGILFIQIVGFLQTGNWSPYSTNDWIGWTQPTDWFGLWKILDKIHPLITVVFGGGVVVGTYAKDR